MPDLTEVDGGLAFTTLGATGGAIFWTAAGFAGFPFWLKPLGFFEKSGIPRGDFLFIEVTGD
jgi:hypothetical protein